MIKRQFKTITSYKWAWYDCIFIVLQCRFQRRKRTRWCRDNESVFFVRCIFRAGFYPWVRKIPWRRKWQPTPAFLPGEFHGQRSLVGYSPWGHKKLDMARWWILSLFSSKTGHGLFFKVILVKPRNINEASKHWVDWILHQLCKYRLMVLQLPTYKELA